LIKRGAARGREADSLFAQIYGQYTEEPSQKPPKSTEAKKQKTEKWLKETIDVVIHRIEERSEHFKANPQGGSSAPEIEQQERKYAFMDRILTDHYKESNKSKSPLSRIIRGYLVEFIRQSEERLPACNIRHGRNPEAGQYWESHIKDFDDARAGGIWQTASGFRKFEKIYPRKEAEGRSAEFHAVGEIVRSSIDVFKEEYPKLDAVNPPAPSVYNDHLASVALAHDMRTLDRLMVAARKQEKSL
jgi:hypothetical protein